MFDRELSGVAGSRGKMRRFASMSSELSRLFEDYGSYHRHPANKLCHYLGIPMIVFTLVGLLIQLNPWVALGVALFAVSYDLRLSVRLTLPFALFVLLSAALAPGLPAAFLWAWFLLGWALQFVGHFLYEKKAPAFFDNLRQLLVGPLWIIGTLGERREAPAAAPGRGRSAE
jgi:uncharacterized membrane protein YGL010W